MSDIPNNPEQKKLAEEYLLLRFVIGAMGMALPVILFLATWGIQPSISHYYYTNMGNVFVGYIIVLSVFLFAYPGYEKDHFFSKAAFLFGCIFALLPTKYLGTLNPPLCHVVFPYKPEIAGKVHLVCASLFLVILMIYSIYLFVKPNKFLHPKSDNPKKTLRNWVYIICGFIMAADLLALLILFLISSPLIDATPVVYWGEVIALEFFGFSWLVKGGALWRDEDTPGPMHRMKRFISKGRAGE